MSLRSIDRPPDLSLRPAKDTALEYWKSLLFFGVGKEALKHAQTDDQDIVMDQGQGWTRRHTEMWLEYMKARDDVAVSKDTWQMVRTVAFFYVHRLAHEKPPASRFHPFI